MTGNWRPLISARVLHKIKELSVPQISQQYMVNHNPRNLEKLRIAYKPSGYHLEKPGRSYWHKLELIVSGRYITAEVKHFENGPVISASTSEWAIKKQLFKTKDTVAFVNLARVLAARCLQSGVTEMQCNIVAVPGGKTEKFLNTVEANGITLKEPERYIAPSPWDAERPERPWEILEDAQASAVRKAK